MAVLTLSGMCVAELTGKGPEPAAFVSTLRTYADGMDGILAQMEGNGDED
jgi:hypothetical protein